MPYKDPEAQKRYFREYHRKNRALVLAKAKAYREANPESVAAAKKRCYERNKSDPVFLENRSSYGKKRRKKDRAHVREIERASYYKHHEKRLAETYAREGTPERIARVEVRKAIRRGEIPKASSLKCVVCKKQANEYHHHLGYSKKHRLSILAVCHQCHKDIHYADTGGTV